MTISTVHNASLQVKMKNEGFETILYLKCFLKMIIVQSRDIDKDIVDLFTKLLISADTSVQFSHGIFEQRSLY